MRRPEQSLTPHPTSSDNISFLPYPPGPSQSGRHNGITVSSKVCKPENFESHNSPNLNFTNIPGKFPWVKLSWYSPETNLGESVDFTNFSLRIYVTLIQKDCYLYAWPFSLCDGRTCFCTGLIPSETLYFIWCLTSLPSINDRPLFLCLSFNVVSPKIKTVLSVNLSANIFAFRDFDICR